MIIDYLHFAYDSIIHRKLRSWLTIIGIIIGIGAIVALISISQGLENAIKEQFEQMGANRLYVLPKGFTGGSLEGLTKKDVDVIKQVGEVEWVNYYILSSDEVEFSREKQFVVQLMGMPTEDMGKKFEDTGFKIEEGRAFLDGEKKVAIVGYKFANDKYKKDVRLNNRITIKEEKFTVVGILAEIGNSDDDNMVIIPEEDFRTLFEKPSDVTMIEIKMKEGIDVKLAADKIKRRLEQARDNENFEIMTPEQILEQVKTLLGIVQLILGGIAAISLIVGAIGISNSMYTNVLERTKEIGIMKSIGAKNMDIMLIFLVEAGVIGFIGGAFGAFLGSVTALATGIIAKSQGFALLKIIIDWKLIIFSIMFAVGIGMIAGVFPARQAAKLKPADSLRY
ncbi:MAG: ABC transporter permease [Candidatus Nanoarchaeia archaeon]